MSHPSRRSVLGAVGAVVGGGAVAAIPGAAAAAPSAPGVLHVLYGTQLRRLGAPGRRRAGSSSTVRGVLHERDGGAAVGEFLATGTVLAEHSMLADELASFEHHLFTLPGGTLTASGTVRHDGTGSFTVTGGSGEYAGVRGAYRSIQSANHGGTGDAVFYFSIGRA